jgi:hypothetical protein
LVVDSGDLFAPMPNTGSDPVLLKAVELMGYDAVGIGDQELLSGPASFVEAARAYSVPFLSANLQYRAGDKPLSLGKPYILKSYDGLRVAVISVMSPKALPAFPDLKEQGLEVRDPVARLKEQVDLLRDKADLFVLLSHSGLPYDTLLAQEVPEIDVIVGAHSQTLLRDPQTAGRALIVQAGRLAKYVGVLSLSIEDGKVASVAHELVPLGPEIPDEPRVRSLVESYFRERTERQEARGPTKPGVPPSGKRIDLKVYYAKDCDKCKEIREVFLPALQGKLGFSAKITYLDVDLPKVYDELYETEDRLNDTDNEIPVVVLGDQIFGGVEEVKAGLEPAIKRIIEQEAQKTEGEADERTPSEDEEH